MRISDWSSDVCSSDLVRVHRHPAAQPSVRIVLLAQSCQRTRTSDTVLGRVKPQCKLKPRRDRGMARMPLARLHRSLQIAQIKALDIAPEHPRSEERRVGKECVSTCRTRWWPYH